MAVPVDATRCDAFGYVLDQPRIAMITSDPGDQFEDYFTGRGIEVDFFGTSQLAQVVGYDLVVWGYNTAAPTAAAFQGFLDTTDTAGTGVVFLDHAFGNWQGISALSEFTGQPASVTKSSTGGTGQSNLYQVTQVHPVLEGFAVGDQILHEPALAAWIAWFSGYEGEGRTVIADAGRSTSGILGSGIGVQERTNNRHVLLSIHGSSATRGPADWSPNSDRIFWNAVEWASPGDNSFECVPSVAGGFVVGNVRDANTNGGVNGATVTVGETSVTTSPTPDDPGQPDGFYWLFSTATGPQQFTASAGNYVSHALTVDVDLDGVTVANFRLRAGELSVTPAEVATTLRLGDRTATRTFTVTNTGTAPAEVEFGEAGGEFVMQRADGSTMSRQQIAGAAGTPLQRLDAPVSFAATAGSGAGFGANAGSVAGPSAPPWVDIANYPTAIMDNRVVTLEGKIYSIGGSSGTASTARGWVYDPATLGWTPIADLPAARNAMTVGVVNGQIVASGGWGPAGPDPATYIYDPAANSWSTMAPNPAPRSAAGQAVLGGKVYAVGGCTTSGCTPMSNTVVAYDVAADAWETLANYPVSVAFASCGAVGGALICTGGNNGTAATNATYSYDPGSNSWTEVANAPADTWASSYSVANGQLLVVGGVQAGLISNAGFAYDPATDAWSPLPNANTARYRGGAACGFFKIGGSVSQFNANVASEMLPGFGSCASGAADVDWLSVAPATATLPVGASVTVTVTTSAAVEQPGVYTAGVTISEDTPYPAAPVGVTMTVTPPLTWGKLAGVVSGVACDGSKSPLQGATVQVNSWAMEFTFATESDGSYAYWIDRRNNPLTLIAAKDGYKPQTRTVRITAGQTTTANFDLGKVGC